MEKIPPSVPSKLPPQPNWGNQVNEKENVVPPQKFLGPKIPGCALIPP